MPIDDLAILDLVIQRLSQVETLVQACQLIQDVLVLDFPPTLLLVYHPLMMVCLEAVLRHPTARNHAQSPAIFGFRHSRARTPYSL